MILTWLLLINEQINDTNFYTVQNEMNDAFVGVQSEMNDAFVGVHALDTFQLHSCQFFQLFA